MPDNIDELAVKQRTLTVNRVALRMKQYHHGDPDKVQHFVRVYTLAKSIGELEHLSDEEQLDLELAAVVHNIDEDDPIPVVRDLLRDCGINDAVNMRVCHMVENDEIRDIVREYEDPAAAVDALIERANYYGGNDNISVICIDLED